MYSRMPMTPWFTECKLKQLGNNCNGVIRSNLDEIPTRYVSYDMSYLTTREEREALFREIVLGEKKESKTD